MRARSLVLALWIASCPLVAAGEAAWPAWRGPERTGAAPAADPPLRWSESENVRFKIPVPGRGLAAPVIWGDRVFVLTAEPVDAEAYAASQQAAADKVAREEWPPSVDPVAQRFLVLAYSRRDGRELWRRVAVERVPHESHYIDSSWASASPVTDGKRLIAHFGSSGTYAYDLDGNPLWNTDLGDMTTRRGFGEGSSPELTGDTVLINWDHEGDSFLVALDAATGKPRWKVERPDEVTSWSTPLVVKVGDREQVVVAATGRSRGYDLETGREIWSLGGMTTNTIPSPVHRAGRVVLASGYRGAMMQAIDLAAATGKLEGADAIAWSWDRDTPYVPSLLLYDDRLYFLKGNKNILSVLDVDTGKPVHEPQRLPDIHTVYASPVGGGGRVYVFDRDGHAVVLRHGGEGFEVLAQNELDEGVDASPALVGDELWVRGQRHLYCISSSAR